MALKMSTKAALILLCMESKGNKNLSIDLQMDETHVISSKQTHHTSKHILLQQQYIKCQTHRKCILSSKRQVVHCSGN